MILTSNFPNFKAPASRAGQHMFIAAGGISKWKSSAADCHCYWRSFMHVCMHDWCLRVGLQFIVLSKSQTTLPFLATTRFWAKVFVVKKRNFTKVEQTELVIMRFGVLSANLFIIQISKHGHFNISEIYSF